MAKKVGNGGLLYGDGGEYMGVQTDQDWVVQGWIPKNGKALLIAPPKDGKTIVATHVGIKVAEGNTVLGYPDLPPIAVPPVKSQS